MKKNIVIVLIVISSIINHAQNLAINHLENDVNRGWTKDIEINFINTCINGYTDNVIKDKNNFCSCLLDKMKSSYTFESVKNLNSQEISAMEDLLAESCLNETGEILNIKNQEIDKAIALTKQKNYKEAIELYLNLISMDNTDYRLYNNISYCYLLSKQYSNAKVYLTEAEKLDSSDLNIKGNLAHVYLLNGDFEKAKSIYLKYKSQSINKESSWRLKIINDFIQFRENGIENEHYDTILELIK